MRLLRAGFASPHGSLPADRRSRLRLRRIALAERRHHAALSQQRHLPRRGDAAIAMRLLWVSNIINLRLDPASFSAGALSKLGVTGARCHFHRPRIGVLYQFYRLLRVRSASASPQPDYLNLAVLWRLLRVSFTHSPIRHRAHQLDRPRAHRQHLRLAHSPATPSHPHVIFIILPSWGSASRRHPRRTEPRRQAARARRTSVWRTGCTT